MSESGVYTLDLVNSATMGNIISLSQAKSRSFKPIFNKPWTFDLTIALADDAAQYIKKLSTGLVVSRNQIPIWSGEATAISKSTAGEGTLSATFTGWLQELDYRYVRKSEEATLTFPGGATGGAILQILLNTVNAQTDTAAVVRPTHVLFGSASDSATRIRSYKVGDNYGNLLRELIAIENGFDISIDPITRRVYTRDPTNFTDQTKARFSYPGNLKDVTETQDGTTVFNRENVVGANGGVISVDDAAAINDAGVMLEEWLSIGDVSDSAVLGSYANAELVYKRYGTTTYSLMPKEFGDMPRPFEDYMLGDKVYFSVDKGPAFQIKDQAVRVFSLDITIDDNGNEIINSIGVAAP